MADTNLPYDLAAVRRLLRAAFSDADLRRFCQDRPAFRPIHDSLSAQDSLEDIVARVIDYCDRHALLDGLLEAVREENPAQYARFEPELRATTADEIALKILKPGSVLLSGRYPIVRHLARGGFGSVYLAQDTLLREQVAIKELIPALVRDEDAVNRFLVEAKAMMQLAHPRIVHTRDIFEAGGNYYMVMEHMRGGSLEDRLKSGRALPVGEAVRIVGEACEGLAYAHAQGVVHCDLKPSNILLTTDGSARVGDFGAAHVSEKVVSHSWITQRGFAGGTLPYMSPEQAEGVRDDPRIDVYALGAVLYRALTGRMYLDFDEENTARAQSDNVQRIYVQQPEPPSTHNDRIPGWLDAVVLKALAKPLEDRYASAAELQAALPGPPSGPEAVTSPPRSRPMSAPRPAVAHRPALATRRAQDLAARLRRLPTWSWLAAGGAAVLVILLAFAISRWIVGGPGGGGTITPSPVAIAANTASPVASATITPSPVASVTPAPIVTPTWTPAPATAAPTEAAAPLCAIAVDPELAQAWDRATLGCPKESADVVWAAWQPFERGYMWWRGGSGSDSDWTYVLFWQHSTNPLTGYWNSEGEAWRWDQVSFAEGHGLTPPPGHFEPIRGLGFVWFDKLGGPESQIGWATDKEKGFCARVQPFEDGMIFRSSTVEYCQDELFNYATQSSFAPLFFSLSDDGRWQRY